MSRLDDLIKELCPNGVEYKRIDECYEIYSGMSGCSLKWKESGNCRFIDYKNAYNNLKIDVDDKPFATVKKLAQNSIRKNDILITTASEVPDECAITAVVEEAIEENVFLDDHLFGIHLIDESVNSTFVNYYMQTQSFRNAVRKKVKGVTRFFVSPSDIGAIFIPVPPLKVQEEIVKILDKFTDYVTELQAELQARKLQYEYYKRCLFENAKDVATTTLDKIAENCDSMRRPVTSGNRVAGEIPYYGASGIVDYVKDYIFDGDYLLVSEDGANLVARVTPIAFSITGKTWVNNHAHVLKFNHYETRRYVEMYLNSIDLSAYITGAAQPKLNQKNLNSIEIPLPDLNEQKRIVSLLDRFDIMCSDITLGLPAEIEARQKQYEYYRDKLLSFKEIES